MPRIGLKDEYLLTTRSQYTKVDCTMNLIVEGNELPSMSVLGEALEKAKEIVQEHITASYKVPERPPTIPTVTTTLQT